MEKLVIRNLSPEIIKKAIETYKSGLSFEQTGERVGLPAHTVRRITLKNNVPVNRYTNSKKIPPDQEQTIVDMYNRGFSMTDIAKKYKVTPDPISRILKKHDVTIRKFYWSGKL